MPHADQLAGMARRMMPMQTREERWNSPLPDITQTEVQSQTRMLERIQATLDLIVSKLEVKTQASGLIQGTEAIEEYEKLLRKDRRLI